MMSAARYKSNEKKAIFIFCLFVVLIFQSVISEAQVRKVKSLYAGFDASFGVKAFNLKSNISEISGMSVVEEGGSAGVVFGSRVMRTTVSAGFYYSASSVKHTVDMFQANAGTSFYPLSMLTKKTLRLEPYFVAGINYDKYKFSGKYLMDDKTAYFSSNSDPYIAHIHQINVNKGFGLEYKLKNKFDFVHVYSEVQFGSKISADTKTASFKNTTVGNNTVVSLGVRFGAFR